MIIFYIKYKIKTENYFTNKNMKTGNEKKKKLNKLFLCKKTKESKLSEKNKNNKNKEELNKDSFLFETSTEISIDNVINLEEKNFIIQGLDDVKIPSFLNDNSVYNGINKKIKNYYKIRKELGSKELAKLYLIDINRLYEEKKKI